MDMYSEIYQEYFALPGIPGKKSESEKFAGADESLSYESLMPDGKALQSCTSHDLGQNFSKVFDIKFQDKNGEEKYVWQTSWGLSTRSLGALVLAHGDDNGLKIPPKLAPIQVIIVPVELNDKILELCRKVKKELESSNIRVKIDTRDGETLGFKINKWELKGVPVRIEIGERELMENELSVARRDNGEKILTHINDISEKIPGLLNKIQKNMLNEAQDHMENNTFDVDDNYKQFKEIMSTSKGFIKAFWCGRKECEANIKEETKATIRCLPFDAKEEKGKCVYCKDNAKYKWIFAQSY
jgi:prolyl-tRNA synthetase